MSGFQIITKEFFEKTDYDLNGNITRLRRSEGILPGSTTALAIDNLKYDYTGNRLTKVTEEQIGNSKGYPYFANHSIITYDENGNMISHKDKGIASIQYNFLNLPNQINGTSGKITKTTNYTYRADGVKVGKSYSQNSAATTTLYLDGFQYKFSANTIWGSELKFVPTSEGYFDYTINSYIYNYTDHLGNVRLSYSDANQDGVIQPRDMTVRECTDMGEGNIACTDIWMPGEIVEVNNYYPFGLMHNYTATTMNTYQYKYNGKELQETGMYDYGARFYMPDVGRWGVVDPLAEKSRRFSTYTYALNNPIMFIDPDGREAALSGVAAQQAFRDFRSSMAPDDWRDKSGKKISSDQLKNVQVYIFYNPDALGGFGDQTMQQYADYEKKYGKGSVALSDAMTEQDFAQDWGDMEGTPSEIVMNHHGSNQQLHLNIDPDNNLKTLDGEYIVSTNNGKTNSSQTPGKKISDLPDPKADISKATLFLNTCNSNNPEASPMTAGTTLAKGFSRYTGVGSVRGTNKKVNFNSSGQATTQWYYMGTWQYFQNGKQSSNPNGPKPRFTVPKHRY